MSWFSKIRGTIESLFSIGIDGPQLKKNGDVLEVRDATDADFQITRGKDPVGNNDYVTKQYFDANNAAAQGLTYAKLAVGTSTVVSSSALPDGAIIRECVLDVETAYDGSATIDVKRTGGSPSIMGTADNKATKLGTYAVPQISDWGSSGAGTVTVTVGGTPTTGAATVYVGYTTPTSIA